MLDEIPVFAVTEVSRAPILQVQKLRSKEGEVAAQRRTDTCPGLDARSPRLRHCPPGKSLCRRSPSQSPASSAPGWASGPPGCPAASSLSFTHDEGDDGSEGRLHLPAVPGDASDPMPRRLRLPGSRVRAERCAPGFSEPGPLEERSITFGGCSDVSGAEGRG